ncbi:MAG: amidohydrolase family protein, partial [Verrucomicrobiia bacterium]
TGHRQSSCMAAALQGIRATLLDAPQWGVLRAEMDGALVVDDGKILARGSFEQLSHTPAYREISWRSQPGLVVVPGLIDLHTHLPQYPGVARGESSLLPWLRQTVFPLERDFTGPPARLAAHHFFNELARHGTTSAMIYSAISEDGTDAAFEEAAQSGLRVTMGKMMMDVASYGNLQPKKIVSVSVAETERLAEKWHGAAEGRVRYAVSPRFAVACSERLMMEAARIATERQLFVQTHLAENIEEIQKVRALFLGPVDYTDVYDKCGLIGERTVLGHCIHLSQREIECLAERRAAIAHCPTSNFFLSSGLMPLDRLRTAGLRIGLASDVAGGPEINLWQVMRSAIETQKARRYTNTTVQVPGPAEVFHMATAAGAAILSQPGVTGTLEPGSTADLLLLDATAVLPCHPEARLDHLAQLTPLDLLALFVYRGGSHAVVETQVGGVVVFSTDSAGQLSSPPKPRIPKFKAPKAREDSDQIKLDFG